MERQNPLNTKQNWNDMYVLVTDVAEKRLMIQLEFLNPLAQEFPFKF